VHSKEDKLLEQSNCKDGDEPGLSNTSDRIAAYLKTKDEILLVYLFGSRAAGKVGKRSDWDIGVLLSEPFPKHFGYALASELAALLGTDRVDLVVLNDAPIPLRYNVVSMGTLLFEKSRSIKVEFEADTMSRYFDYLPVLRQQRRDIVEGKGYDARVQRYRQALGKTRRVLEQIRAAQGQTA